MYKHHDCVPPHRYRQRFARAVIDLVEILVTYLVSTPFFYSSDMGHHNRHFAGDTYAHIGIWGPPTSAAK